MNQSQIPKRFHWLIPLVTELTDQCSREVDEFSLSSEYLELIGQRMTVQLRKDIEVWIGTANSDEAAQFLMATTYLDELGLLEQSEPSLNYEYWRDELRSPLWGNVRGAVQIVASDYLAGLSKEERRSLDADVESILKSATNTNVRIWLKWLRCQIDDKLDIGRDFLRAIIDDSPLDRDEEWDLGEDACAALVSMPHVSSHDLDSVMRYVFRSDIDEFKAAVALEALLASSYVPAEVKTRATELARKSSREELREVVDLQE